MKFSSYDRSPGAAVAPPRLLFWCLLPLLIAIPIRSVSPATALWATPAILLAAMMIAWAAESAQFFVAQGFALAILAWLQTLPEFAVEFVLAWKQQVPLLGVLLGPHCGAGFHVADEHGFQQYQPVDPAGRHAAHRVFDQSR